MIIASTAMFFKVMPGAVNVYKKGDGHKTAPIKI
jgi:hypothetical protein